MATATATKPATKPQSTGPGMVAIMRFYQIPIAQFRAMWGKLDEADKAQLTAGVGAQDNGAFAGPLDYTLTDAEIATARARVLAVPEYNPL